MRNDTTKRLCKKEGAQALAHPEVVPGACRKVQPRNTRAGRPKHTAKTTGSTNSLNQMTQRQPSVKGVEYSAPQTVRSVALGGEQQQLNSQPSKTITNRLQPHTLSSSESSAPIRASRSPVASINHCPQLQPSNHPLLPKPFTHCVSNSPEVKHFSASVLYHNSAFSTTITVRKKSNCSCSKHSKDLDRLRSRGKLATTHKQSRHFRLLGYPPSSVNRQDKRYTCSFSCTR
jgi:hypothetical protein